VKEPLALAPLFDALERAPFEHDFFALLRRIENAAADAPRIGRAQRPSQEPLRLSQEPELDFAPASLTSFERSAHGAPRLGVRLFGLLGPHGPLPLHLTEYVRERLRQRGDPTLARFLDLFHHRLLTLFYRAWAEAQPTVQHDRPREDRFSVWLGSAAGLGAHGGTAALPRSARLFQVGLLGARSTHAEGLEKLLSHYFGLRVAVLPHTGHWMALDRRDRSRLGSARLRTDAALGHKAWDRQSKFRIALGPLSLDQYRAFLPGGDAWPALREWVAAYAGSDRLWDLQLGLQAREVPPARLADKRVRLGLTSWLGRRGAARDRADLRLRPGSSFVLRQPGGHHG